MDKGDVFLGATKETVHNMTLVSQSSTGRGIPNTSPSLAAGGGASLRCAHGRKGASLHLRRTYRSPAHKHFTLPDLEWHLLPSLALGQFMVGETRLQNGQALPLALVLWARVSAEVDARLSAEARGPVRLQPNEWQSGDVFWIVDAVGELKAVQECVEALTKTRFGTKQFKFLRVPNVN